MAKMASHFMRAASIGTAADGLMKTLPPQGQELLNQITAALATQLSAKPGEEKPGLAGSAAMTPAPMTGNGEPVEVVATRK